MKLSRSECREKVLEIVEGDLSEDMEKSCVDLPTAYKMAQSRLKIRPKKLVLPTFQQLTSHMGGIGNYGLTVITGPTGAGKSTIVGNLWANYVALGINCYAVPIEIGLEDFIEMLFSIYSGKVRRNLSHDDFENAMKSWYVNFFSNSGNVIAKHESRLSHIDYLAEVYYHHLTRNIGVAFADNWNFMIEPGDDIAQSDRALHDIIVFSKKIPVHHYMIMHPKKPEKGGADDRVQSIYDVKGSSTSIQESHNVLIFNRLQKDSDAPPMVQASYCREVLIAKARYNGRARGSKAIYSIDNSSEKYLEHQLI